MKLQNLRKTAALISISLFVLSLTQDAFTVTDFDGSKIHSSMMLLLTGGFVILGGGLFEWIIWLANPLFLTAFVLFLRRRKSSRYFSLAAAILAISFITWEEVLASESGRMAPIGHLCAGYWLWLFSILVLTSGTFYYFRLAGTKAEHVNIPLADGK